MRPILLVLLALAALAAGVAAQASCGLKLSMKKTTRADKSRKSKRGQLRLKYAIKNENAEDVTDAAFEIAFPAGVTLSKAHFKPKLPVARGPIFSAGNANATWVNIHIKAQKKRKIRVSVNAAGAPANAPLVFAARAFRHDGSAPLPCEGSIVSTQ